MTAFMTTTAAPNTATTPTTIDLARDHNNEGDVHGNKKRNRNGENTMAKLAAAVDVEEVERVLMLVIVAVAVIIIVATVMHLLSSPW